MFVIRLYGPLVRRIEIENKFEYILKRVFLPGHK